MLWLVVHEPLLNIVDAHVLQFCNVYVFLRRFGRVYKRFVVVRLFGKRKNKRCFTHSVASVEAFFDKVEIFQFGDG
jgi:hypothetical protein